MGILAALLGAGIKTGVSVATDLLNNTPMPTVKNHHKNKNNNDNNKPANHTRRSYEIDNGFFLSESPSKPNFELHETVIMIIFWLTCAIIITSVMFLILMTIIRRSHIVVCNARARIGDEERLFVNQENYQQEEQTTLLAKAERLSSSSYGGIQVTSTRTNIPPIYTPYDDLDENTPSSNIIVFKSTKQAVALRGTGDCSTGIWIVENDTGLRYQ